MAEESLPAAGARSPVTGRSGQGRSGWLERNARFVLPMPAVLAVLAMLAFPLAYTLYMSMQDWTISSVADPKFVGLDNFVTLFTTDLRFRNSIFVTFYFTILGVTIQTFLGVTLALLFNRQFWDAGCCGRSRSCRWWRRRSPSR